MKRLFGFSAIVLLAILVSSCIPGEVKEVLSSFKTTLLTQYGSFDPYYPEFGTFELPSAPSSIEFENKCEEIGSFCIVKGLAVSPEGNEQYLVEVQLKKNPDSSYSIVESTGIVLSCLPEEMAEFVQKTGMATSGINDIELGQRLEQQEALVEYMKKSLFAQVSVDTKVSIVGFGDHTDTYSKITVTNNSNITIDTVYVRANGYGAHNYLFRKKCGNYIVTDIPAGQSKTINGPSQPDAEAWADMVQLCEVRSTISDIDSESKARLLSSYQFTGHEYEDFKRQ